MYLRLSNILVPVAVLCVRRNVVWGAHMVTASLLKKDDKCATLQIKTVTTLNPPTQHFNPAARLRLLKPTAHPVVTTHEET
jgi:hypothetical protein